METKIFLQGVYRNIRPNDPVKTSRAITSFASSNNLRDCMFKAQGGWYKIGLDGILIFATRTLYSITFTDLYQILKD